MRAPGERTRHGACAVATLRQRLKRVQRRGVRCLVDVAEFFNLRIRQPSRPPRVLHVWMRAGL